MAVLTPKGILLRVYVRSSSRFEHIVVALEVADLYNFVRFADLQQMLRFANPIYFEICELKTSVSPKNTYFFSLKIGIQLSNSKKKI